MAALSAKPKAEALKPPPPPPLPRAAIKMPLPTQVEHGQQKQHRSLLNMCIQCVGSYLHDIVDEIHLIASLLPPLVKVKLVAIARRRGLLCDKLLLALADESWDLLDVSGSDVTDQGISAVAQVCRNLKAVDMSLCSMLTSDSVRALVRHCAALETLRCGGTHMSNKAARTALPSILPRLDIDKEAEESWEDVQTEAVGQGAQSLRWIVWPSIDENSKELIQSQCPRIAINPKPAKLQPGLVPREALPTEPLDQVLVQDLDPCTWSVKSRSLAASSPATSASAPELHIAERFRLAFLARDERLAPKRAKNWRQNQRRAGKAWLDTDVDAKSRYLAGALE